jgi:hypothetical protein
LRCRYWIAEQEFAKTNEHLHTENEQLRLQLSEMHSQSLQNCRLEKENEMLYTQLEKLEKQLKEYQVLVGDIAKRPSTVNTTNEICNVKITNYLSDRATYDQQTDPDRIISLGRNHFESYFWQGQHGVAKFVVDHVIKSSDGKMLIVCTDPSRKRFKYMTANNLLAEDIGALQFTERISVPMKTVCQEVFNSIMSKIDQQKESLSETHGQALEIGRLEIERDLACEKIMAIREFSDVDSNGDFINSLCSLARPKNE